MPGHVNVSTRPSPLHLTAAPHHCTSPLHLITAPHRCTSALTAAPHHCTSPLRLALSPNTPRNASSIPPKIVVFKRSATVGRVSPIATMLHKGNPLKESEIAYFLITAPTSWKLSPPWKFDYLKETN
ncbi:hypothetical protein K435DRAFT_864396 [Dendrothele bispora CBS 962.96]|uniref:Uncharacterized protein n=1 Tax=Dendrothele bispora (strain CBS 962.96) TaxID=1314807 RepID=A0A4S8LMI3_DENBC|nr:hypothetical protein K435DRAFT_864396 [Dendrothele bispora CBS 962.96]